MTTSNPDESTDRTAARERPESGRSPAGQVLDLLRHVAFWTAVVLPLAAGGLVLPELESPAQWRLFFVVAVTSVVALYIGLPKGED